MDSEKLKSPKKLSKKKQKKSPEKSKPFIDSDDDSDDEKPSFINGVNTTIDDMDESSNEGGWTSDDDYKLVAKVKSDAKSTDKVNYKTRLSRFNWDAIAFKNHSGDDCEKRFKYHLKSVRRHRNLCEIVTDIEENIKKCPIKKPLNSYQLFVQSQLLNVKSSGDFAETMKSLATRYKTLTASERAVYEGQAEQLRAEYKKNKANFMAGNPITVEKQNLKDSKPKKTKTPFILFSEDMEKENGKTDLQKVRESYTKLPIDEKYKYIVRAVSLAPDVNQTTLLNKEEQRIFKGQVKTTPTAYSLFVKEMFPKVKASCGSVNAFTECAKIWKTLDEKKRKMYKEASLIMKEKANKEQDAFNERLGVTPSKVKKRRKSSFAERDTETEEALFTPPLEPAKKRKKSESSQIESGVEDIKDEIFTPPSTPIKTPSKTQSVQSTPNKFIPMTVIHTPLGSFDKKRNKTISETSEQLDSDAASTTSSSKKKSKKKKRSMSEASESHASDASTLNESSDSIKKSKKKKKSKEPQPPENKPPSSLFKYFAASVHTGKPQKAQKAFDKLTKKERKKLNAEYNELVDSYVTKLKAYLGAIPEAEAVAYVSKIKAAEDADAAKEANGNGAESDDSSQEY